MKIGTINTDIKPSTKLRKRSALSGSGSSNGGKDGGDGGNNGGNDPLDDLQNREYEKSFSKSKIFTWFLLIVVVMTFGGVIGAYIVISTNGVHEWRPFNLPYQVYLSTLLILVSSTTYIVAQKAVYQNQQPRAKNWLLATTILGGIFISSQIVAWLALANRGFYLGTNPYAAFFYIMTALHAVHVLGGIIALGYVVLQNWHRTDDEKLIEKRRDMAGSVGWYWHFMGGLWLVLLCLLGFWK